MARSILVQLPSSFFFTQRLLGVHVMHPYSSMDTTAAWNKLCFVLSDLYMNDSISVAFHAFAIRILMRRFRGEIVLQFLGVTSSGENVSSLILIKSYVLYFVCIGMEAYTASCFL